MLIYTDLYREKQPTKQKFLLRTGYSKSSHKKFHK